MDEYDVKRLGLIYAVYAEIEGMKSENYTRQLNNLANAYTDQDFQDKAEELKSLAHCHNEQLFG